MTAWPPPSIVRTPSHRDCDRVGRASPMLNTTRPATALRPYPLCACGCARGSCCWVDGQDEKQRVERGAGGSGKSKRVMARVRAHGAARLLKWRAAAWTLDRKALTPRLQLFIVADMAPARSCAASLTVHQCLSRSRAKSRRGRGLGCCPLSSHVSVSRCQRKKPTALVPAGCWWPRQRAPLAGMKSSCPHSGEDLRRKDPAWVSLLVPAVVGGALGLRLEVEGRKACIDSIPSQPFSHSLSFLSGFLSKSHR